jgi:integrase
MLLKEAKLRNAKADAKPRRLFDGEGLYIEVRPNGGKWWRFKYRFDGKEKLISFGTYPDVSLTEARDKRADARSLVAKGVDPSAARKSENHARRQQAQNTLECVVRDWLSHRAAGWADATRDTVEASLANHVLPSLGSRPIAAITTRDIKQVVQAIDKAGAGETAGRVFQRLRSIFRHALSEELVAADPTYPLKPAEMFKPRAVKHRLAMTQAGMPQFLQRLAGYEGDPSTAAALELLILTATRPGEVRGARWDEFDEQRATWRIPAARMKMATEHIVPLSQQALAVLARMRPVSGGSEFVFPSPYYPGASISDGTLNSALARMGYKGVATAHGFRTLFSTCANEHGWKGDLIEKQLAHEERDEVRGAYNRAQYLAERAELMQWWGAEVAALRGA